MAVVLVGVVDGSWDDASNELDIGGIGDLVIGDDIVVSEVRHCRATRLTVDVLSVCVNEDIIDSTHNMFGCVWSYKGNICLREAQPPPGGAEGLA